MKYRIFILDILLLMAFVPFRIPRLSPNTLRNTLPPPSGTLFLDANILDSSSIYNRSICLTIV